MSKQTLLEMTQEILSSMDSDEVNSISDTSEALQVAYVIRRCYWDLVNKLNPPEHYRLFELEATSSSTPTMMTMPTDIIYLEWVKYNHATTADDTPQFKNVTWMNLDDFLGMMYSLDDDETTIDSFTYTETGDSIDFMCYNDRQPTWYTTYNDNLLIFDSYESDEDTNLQKTKTLCYGKELPGFAIADGTIPDLDAPQFSILLNKAKALCFAEIKQTDHQLALREENRQLVTSMKSKRAIKTKAEVSRAPNYGRKAARGR